MFHFQIFKSEPGSSNDAAISRIASSKDSNQGSTNDVVPSENVKEFGLNFEYSEFAKNSHSIGCHHNHKQMLTKQAL